MKRANYSLISLVKINTKIGKGQTLLLKISTGSLLTSLLFLILFICASSYFFALLSLTIGFSVFSFFEEPIFGFDTFSLDFILYFILLMFCTYVFISLYVYSLIFTSFLFLLRTSIFNVIISEKFKHTHRKIAVINLYIAVN